VESIIFEFVDSIWSHLVNLAATTNTTVIITTHFIEEARESNCVRECEEEEKTFLSKTFFIESWPTLVLAQILLPSRLGSCGMESCWQRTLRRL